MQEAILSFSFYCCGFCQAQVSYSKGSAVIPFQRRGNYIQTESDLPKATRPERRRARGKIEAYRLKHFIITLLARPASLPPLWTLLTAMGPWVYPQARSQTLGGAHVKEDSSLVLRQLPQIHNKTELWYTQQCRQGAGGAHRFCLPGVRSRKMQQSGWTLKMNRSWSSREEEKRHST